MFAKIAVISWSSVMEELMILLVTTLIRLAFTISVLCLSVLDAFHGTATTMGTALKFHDIAFVTEPFTLHLILDTRACFVRCSRDEHLWLALQCPLLLRKHPTINRNDFVRDITRVDHPANRLSNLVRFAKSTDGDF
jgi:hypothetical protein